MDQIYALTDDLLSFINKSATAFHAAAALIQSLEKEGFQALQEDEHWSLKPGHKYYVTRNSSAVVAFITGTEDPAETGFKIIGAHTDSPLFKVKNESETISGNYLKLGVEVYGGPIINTWLDRELSLAGRVMISEKGRTLQRLIKTKRPVAVIPNLAIHMNREVNKGVELNKQSHLPAIFSASGQDPEKGALRRFVAKEVGTHPENIGEMDLFLFDSTPGMYAGMETELITAGRLDNLAMCHAALKALLPAGNKPWTSVAVFYDNEEVGSQTLQGAGSFFLKETLQRILLSEKETLSDSWYRAAARSFMISADMAHALHPNYAEKHDPDYAPRINKGPVIKLNANFRYATTAETAFRFEQLCKEEKIPCQKMTNRSDIPSGSTIGPVSSSSLGIKTVDVGNPMWAMHSIRETAGVIDHDLMTRAFTAFYSRSL
jgi:aspartyl aminopeptidase